MMNKWNLISTLFVGVSASLDWAVRCEFENQNCSGRLISCAQFKLTNGCANDGTGYQIVNNKVKIEEGACNQTDAEGVLNFSALAQEITSGSCIEVPEDPDNGLNAVYYRYYATDDGTSSLRSYTLSDLAKCASGVYPIPSSDDFVDTYISHDDPFECSESNTQNRYSYVTRNGFCDKNGARALFKAPFYLTVEEYENQEECLSKVSTPEVYYYRADGSCHVGMFKSVRVGTLQAHVGLCGEPSDRVPSNVSEPYVASVPKSSLAAAAAALGSTACSD